MNVVLSLDKENFRELFNWKTCIHKYWIFILLRCLRTNFSNLLSLSVGTYFIKNLHTHSTQEVEQVLDKYRLACWNFISIYRFSRSWLHAHVIFYSQEIYKKKCAFLCLLFAWIKYAICLKYTAQWSCTCFLAVNFYTTRVSASKRFMNCSLNYVKYICIEIYFSHNILILRYRYNTRQVD